PARFEPARSRTSKTRAPQVSSSSLPPRRVLEVRPRFQNKLMQILVESRENARLLRLPPRALARLMRARRERHAAAPTKKRDELATSQLIEWHSISVPRRAKSKKRRRENHAASASSRSASRSGAITIASCPHWISIVFQPATLTQLRLASKGL